MTRINVFLLAAGLALASPGAFGAWGWLRGSAVSEFTDADWEAFKEQATEVLADGADGVTVEWRNPDSGAHGLIKPLATFMYEGRPCRTTAFRTTSRRGTTGQSVYTVCQQADGTWQLAPDGTRDQADGDAAAAEGGR